VPSLVLGPILRYADERAATIWVQTDVACEVEILGVRERTWCVSGLHFALVAVDGLEAGRDHPYEVRLDGAVAWPEPASPFPPSTLRLPAAGAPRDIVFGSCRITRPHEPPFVLRADQDEAGQGIDAAVIGLNAAMFPLAVLVIGPVLPRLLARLGSLRSLYLGLSVTALSVLLLPVLPGLAAWFCLRFLGGAAASIQWVISETWLNIIATDRDRGRIMGLYASVLAAGFAIGPLIIGAVGVAGWLPFLLVALAIALAAVPIAFAGDLVPSFFNLNKHGYALEITDGLLIHPGDIKKYPPEQKKEKS